MSETVDPEDAFEIEEKIGEGSYGSVLRARHRKTGREVAIKIIPLENDDEQFKKEIAILKSCKCDNIVRYYGSYYKGNDLWIIMEYCGAGSISDLMMKGRFPLKEDEIRLVVSQVLVGLAYLHDQRKIHRDIKAGNILLTEEGTAKLADFGVSAQLDSTMSKRNTVIGTPFWMAPEVIQEEDYNWIADIWSLGITAIELAEGVPPYSNIHPMRAIFMIPNRPPPRLQDEKRWSSDFVDFVNKCLIKDPARRPSSYQLLSHPFVKNTVAQINNNTVDWSIMKNMITRLRVMKSKHVRVSSRSGSMAAKGSASTPASVSTPASSTPAIPTPAIPTPASASVPSRPTRVNLLYKPDASSASSSGTLVKKPGVSKQPPSPKKPTYKPSNQSLSSSIRSNSESSIPQHIPTNRKSQPPARPAGPAGPAGPATQKPQRISSPSITNSMAKPPPIKSSLVQPLSSTTIDKKQSAIDVFVNQLITALPTKQPESGASEWIKLRNTGNRAIEQFKEDLRDLAGGYIKKIDKIKEDMNKFVCICLFYQTTFILSLLDIFGKSE